MTSPMPELGSTISLISKADIRYEGRLFTVDPQECTIALASVRSFGTEERDTLYPVAPQNQVYEYILFRGSDIKDIRIVPTLPNDPAIMQLSVPPNLGPIGAATPYQPSQFSQYPQFPPYHSLGGLPPAIRPTVKAPSELSPQVHPPSSEPIGIPPMHVPQPHSQPLQAKDQGNVLDLIVGNSVGNSASRSNTPGPVAHRKSPTADQGTQAGSGGGQRNARSATNDERRAPQRRQPQQQQQLQQPPQPPQVGQQQPVAQQPSNANSNQRPRPRSRNRNNQIINNQPPHPQHQPHHQPPLHQAPPHQYYQQATRGIGGWRGGGRGGPRGGGRGGSAPPTHHAPPPLHHQQNRQPQRQPPRPKNTLKFENDYDFEQANTQFEELRSQLAKIKIDGEAKGEPAEAEKKDDSGNETGAGEPEPEEDQNADGSSAYDKTKSFFDNISCEAVERSMGRSQRTDWRTERKLNSETFGVASARRAPWRGARMGWRGAWRGRGQHHRGGTRHQQHHAQQHVQQPATGN